MVIDHTKIFSTEDTLEATLAKCNNFLSSFGVPASSTNRKTRMMNLTSSSDSSRKKLFEAVLAFKSLPSPNCCNFCFRGKVQVQCAESPVKFMRSSCDEKVHKLLFSTTSIIYSFFGLNGPTIFFFFHPLQFEPFPSNSFCLG